jgi:hypothetical protein
MSIRVGEKYGEGWIALNLRVNVKIERVNTLC